MRMLVQYGINKSKSRHSILAQYSQHTLAKEGLNVNIAILEQFLPLFSPDVANIDPILVGTAAKLNGFPFH